MTQSQKRTERKAGRRKSLKQAMNFDFETGYVNGDDEELTDAIAEKIIEIFADEERLEEFHQNSYENAKDLLEK